MDVFDHNDQLFIQHLFVEEDDRVEIQDEDGKVFVTFTASCEIMLGEEIIGRIHQRDRTLCYSFRNDSETYFDSKVPITDMDCYFKAEKHITLFLAQMAEQKGVTIPELATYFSKVK